MSLTCEELLQGAAATHEVAIPPEVLHPANGSAGAEPGLPATGASARVRLRPAVMRRWWNTAVSGFHPWTRTP